MPALPARKEIAKFERLCFTLFLFLLVTDGVAGIISELLAPMLGSVMTNNNNPLILWLS